MSSEDYLRLEVFGALSMVLSHSLFSDKFVLVHLKNDCILCKLLEMLTYAVWTVVFESPSVRVSRMLDPLRDALAVSLTLCIHETLVQHLILANLEHSRTFG